MHPSRKQDSDGRIAALLTNMADGLGRLVSEHIALARIELTEDARSLATGLGQTALFLSLILIGYVFVCASLVAFLASQWMSQAAALLIVGGGNLVVGAIGAFSGFRRMSARPVMRETRDQLDRTAEALLPGARANGSEVADDKRL